MKLICHIYDQSRKSTRAIVAVTYGDNSKKQLRLNRKRGTFEIDLDVKEGEKITFLIEKKGYERIVQPEFARTDDYHFVLGEKGMKYRRVGNSRVPFNTYEGLYAIEGS